MATNEESESRTASLRSASGLTRRDVLVGAAATALLGGASSAVAAASRARRQPSAPLLAASLSANRYMAASAVLADGRILIAGGYGRRWTEGSSISPLSSVVILDPNSGQSYSVAPMVVPRARHAAVTLSDGRVAVLGGVGINPTASVEIYDPRTNRWQSAASLSQPRYDHSAVFSGGAIYVLGGMSLSGVSGFEVLYPELGSASAMRP